MRTLLVLCVFLLLYFSTQKSSAQDYIKSCDMVPLPEESEVQSVQYKGKYITSTGTLRVLVVIIRFADDNETSSIWPNVTIKPDWIENFVNANYSSTGNYYPGTVSDYFYQNSYGNLHIIGDVYYVTLPQNESYYHEYAFNNSATAARGLIEMEALNIIDSAPYNVNFALYDNWKYLSNYNTISGQDGVLDMCWLITRNLHDQNYSQNNYKIGAGWAGLDCATHTRDGVTIKTGGEPNDWVLPNSGITIFRDLINYGINPLTYQYGNFTNVNIVAHEMTHHFFDSGHYADGNRFLNLNSRYASNMLSYVGGWMGEYSGYEKWRLGWTTPTSISADGDYVLWDLSTTPTDPIKKRLYKITIPGTSQFYLIENRSWVGTFESRYNMYGGPDAILKPGILVYQVVAEPDIFYITPVFKLDADGRYKWKIIYHGSDNSNMWDDVIEKDYPDRLNGYSETEYIFIDNYSNQKWRAEWHPNTLTPYNGGDYMATYSNNGQIETTDWTGDYLDIFGVGEVISPWSNPGSHKWTATGFAQTNIGLEILSFNTANSTYTLRVRLSNPIELSPSKPFLGAFHAGDGPIYYGWAYLAWGADYWDGQPIESDINWSELQRKISDYGTWQTVYTGPNRHWSDNSIIYDPEHGDTPVYFRVRVRDNQNLWSVWSDLFDTRTFTGVEGESTYKKKQNNQNLIPTDTELLDNYPNPFNPSTIIKFAIKDVGLVSLKVYDILGSEVATLVNETKEAGYHSVEFNAANLPSGVYIYTLQVNGYTDSKKMLLMK
jgi:M6 family metalloprotease-like protein